MYYKINIPRSISVGVGIILIFFACAEFWVSFSLNKYKFSDINNFEADTTAFINDPAHIYEKISTYKTSNKIMECAILAVRDAKSASPEIENSVAKLTEDYLNSYQKRNVVSSVHIINLCNTYVTLKNEAIDVNSSFFKLFKATLLEHLSRFPERADMTIGYLNFCFNKLQNPKELEFMADAVLKVSASHPVGLWFKALAQLCRGIDQQHAITKMKNAVSGGLLRFMPIEKEILKGLGIQ